ncbi:MAG TPA: HD domain-containing phosphohydrolase [Phycisphaerae bacterium]|nr:HD domain-containing phosphohydrolase [Phycisphaerae bacterium]HNU45725.1 HD domain-containing phosphohydrolase [Phycisphaerae bacterium]
MVDYSQALSNAENLEAILDATLAAAAELTCSRRLSILLPDPHREYLTIARSVGIDPEVAKRIQIPIGKGVAGEVFQRRQATVGQHASQSADQPARYSTDIYASMPLVCSAMNETEVTVGVLNVTERYDNKPFSSAELECLNLLCSVAGCAIHDALNRRAREEARDSIVVALAQLAEHRDDDTGKHLDRVTRFCVLLAEELGRSEKYRAVLDDAFIHDLQRAVPLHDIGKVAIPDSILLKPGKLTPEERVIMQTHTEVGTRTIQSIIARTPGVSFLHMAEGIASGHHERWDGNGYPRGLAGENIPLAARIASVADVYDALTTQRVYKAAMPHERALQIIKEGTGTQFDPEIVQAFLTREGDFATLAKELIDTPAPAPAAPAPTPALTPELAAVSA